MARPRVLLFFVYLPNPSWTRCISCRLLILLPSSFFLLLFSCLLLPRGVIDLPDYVDNIPPHTMTIKVQGQYLSAKMNGMLWGVAAMVVKDAIKQPYLKGRDYERNVRQAYRDVDNLKITLEHVRANCTPEDLTTGPHAVFIRRAEIQLKDAYRTLDREYPRKAGFSRLLEHASTPGAEMALLDIGKEANQTARGLSDLLSEIRFARMGKAKQGGDKGLKDANEKNPRSSSRAHKDHTTSPRRCPSPKRFSSSPKGTPILHPSHPAAYDMDLYGGVRNMESDGFGSPRSLSSGDRDSLFDRPGLKPSSVYSPPSSTGDSSQGSSSSRSKHMQHHRHHHSSREKTRRASTQKQNLLQPSSPPSSWPKTQNSWGETMKSHSRTRERELALDNLQHGIDNALRAQASCSGSDGHYQQQEEEEAMEYLEYALGEILRLSHSSSTGRHPNKTPQSVDQDLCDAVEDLDQAMKGLVAARSDKDKKYALRRVSRSLEVLDAALAERKKVKCQERAPRKAEGGGGGVGSRSCSSRREAVPVLVSRRGGS